MLNLEQLNAFIAAVEKGSFSAAARHIGKSQSSVSIGVNNLELDLGVELFDRSTKYPQLTEQGERLYHQAKALMRQATRMESYAKGVIEAVEDQLVIGADPLVPMSVFDSALEKMAEKFPFTRVKLVKLTGNHLNRAIEADEVDVGFNIMSEAVPENLDFIGIARIEWVCICSPDYKFADLEAVDSEMLINERQIVCSSMLQNEYLAKLGRVSQETWEASDLDDMIRLVEQGIGWGIIPLSMYEEKAAIGTLSTFKPVIEKETGLITVDLLWKSTAQLGPAKSFFIDLLKR
ncbi:LysR family transcriptional regulator [Shewanella loihica]|uniref:Transcriptional regulator, LysR family n=1 Tax=Shewanella loihica (strain ATCC BAA-1088 / PV-4) TaxID=323850 RepID=A3QJL6_SHELP|nr:MULTISPECIES: LysR family transcriptional regulator [Shewanella]ABO25664.1 transcriptional regulator, LysR family [Shewanella loihica PV-4]QYJ93787.1 LysR family transcriptional regulator [Shewanella spartinae]